MKRFYQRAYPVDAFHNLVRDTVYELMEKIKAPDSLIAMSIMAALSTCTQGLADVLLPDGRVCSLALYLMTFAESGSGKTTIDKRVNQPFVDFDRRKKEEHKVAMAEFHAAKHLWEVDERDLRRQLRQCRDDGEKEGIRKDILAHARAKPIPSHQGRLIYQDFTERALREALQGDGMSIAVLSDEAVDIMDREVMAAYGLLNSIWSGASSLPFDRAGMDFVDVQNPRLTIGTMMQPEVFERVLEKRGHLARSTGHLARFLFAHPASTKGTRWMDTEEQEWNKLPTFHARVSELLEQYEACRASGRVQREVLVLSPEAKEEWVKVYNQVEADQGPFGRLRDVTDFASKAMEMAGRMAGIFHVFTGQKGAISLETLQRAMDVIWWHLDCYIGLFGTLDGLPQDVEDMQKVASYLHRRYWSNGAAFAERNEVYKCGPLRDRSRFGIALDALVAQGAIWIGQGRTGRRFINLHWAYFNRFA